MYKLHGLGTHLGQPRSRNKLQSFTYHVYRPRLDDCVVELSLGLGLGYRFAYVEHRSVLRLNIPYQQRVDKAIDGEQWEGLVLW